MKLTQNDMLNIVGGAAISGTLLNAITKLVTIVFEIGRSIGSAISMARSGKKC